MKHITALETTINNTQAHLLAQRHTRGYWEGRLSGSALSTATAVFALACVDHAAYRQFIDRGLGWLQDHQNADGGWGDSIKSESNLSTTLLCYGALSVGNHNQTVTRAEQWIKTHFGTLEPDALAHCVSQAYGKDRSFSVPILTLCALAGRLGPSDRAWQRIRPLPFEVAVLPQRLFKWLQLPVVSYALPALIAIGQVGFHHRRPKCPVKRWIREQCISPTLKRLARLQPQNGGFLEATPLTSFVVMSLATSGRANHEVVTKGVRFLTDSARPDGCWPIDTNLATWVTTSAVNAVGAHTLATEQRDALLTYLLESQSRSVHPYTQAQPGGWGWSALAGAVPDADDTSGALVALANLDSEGDATRHAAQAGIQWLLDLQNRDGGIPTFCRGWSNLLFDRSCPDITAHALTAMHSWQDIITLPLHTPITRAIHYLERTQHPDGYWIPLWFGNEGTLNKENPTYGTGRVLTHLAKLPSISDGLLTKALDWLLSIQHPSGGWGGNQGVTPSIEETAVAVDALAEIHLHQPNRVDANLTEALGHGVSWLITHTKNGTHFPTTPIGLYFAQLWYYENLYPVVFALAALNKYKQILFSLKERNTPPMPKFVIHKHLKQDEPTHWDLMLEQGEGLTTYRLDLPPRDILSQPATATPIADHDKRFLTYEGPVNQGLGKVRMVDSGTYEMHTHTETHKLLTLKGSILSGEFELTVSQTQPGTLILQRQSR